MTNQTPSSKKKKDAQDELKEEHGIEVVILDGEWILEKVYSGDFIELVVNSLNLSDVYKKKKSVLGQNDTSKIKELAEIEEKINNSDRYFENDFQLVEDALQSAILSRMLERSKEEVEGKFDRAFRYCKKVNNSNQWIRFYYQKAWTYCYWYDDYPSFVEEYKKFQKLVLQSINTYTIELYITLFSTLRSISLNNLIDLSEINIDLQEERKQLYEVLWEIEQNKSMPCSSLIARTHLLFQKLIDSIEPKENCDQYLSELSACVLASRQYLDYPFDTFKKMIEGFGRIFPDSQEFDNLVDTLASISEQRHSELSAGETFFRRGIQKLIAKSYKSSVVYFGKSVTKFAKEESQDIMYFALMGLSQAYSSLGLIWASNNCLIYALSISFKEWFEKGLITEKIHDCAKQLTLNELLLGRLPSFLSWHELFYVTYKQLNLIHDDEKNLRIDWLIDGLFSVRMLNTNNEENRFFSFLPGILARQNLWLSQNSCLYKLGHINSILDDFKEIMLNDEPDIDKHFKMMANQPFKMQMLHKTNFVSDSKIKLSSTILGCEFNICFNQDKELLLEAETLLAFLESFLSTSLENVYPHSNIINLEITRNTNIECIDFRSLESSNDYIVELGKSGFSIDSM